MAHGRKRVGDHVEIEIIYRFGGKGADGAVEARDAPFTIGMDTVGKKDKKCFGERVDPDSVAGEAGVPIGAEREKLAARATETTVDITTETSALSHSGWSLNAGHHFDGFGFHDADAVQFT